MRGFKSLYNQNKTGVEATEFFDTEQKNSTNKSIKTFTSTTSHCGCAVRAANIIGLKFFGNGI